MNACFKKTNSSRRESSIWRGSKMNSNVRCKCQAQSPHYQRRSISMHLCQNLRKFWLPDRDIVPMYRIHLLLSQQSSLVNLSRRIRKERTRCEAYRLWLWISSQRLGWCNCYACYWQWRRSALGSAFAMLWLLARIRKPPKFSSNSSRCSILHPNHSHWRTHPPTKCSGGDHIRSHGIRRR